MKKHMIAVLGIFIFCSSTQAGADIYGEFMLGSAEQKEEFDSLPEISGSDISLGVRFGWRFLTNLSAEVSYEDYGDAEDSVRSFDTTLNTSSIGLGLKGIYEFKNGIAIVGRVGVSSWKYDYRDKYSDGDIDTADDKGEDLYYGVGVEYGITERFYLGISYSLMPHEVSPNGIKYDREITNMAFLIGMSL